MSGTINTPARLTRLTRRGMLVATGGALVAGCAPGGGEVVSPAAPPPSPALARPPMYGPMPNERFPIPAVDISQVDRRWWRATVPNPTGEPPGTLVVDTPARYLYFTRPDGSAVRYGVGVGDAGFEWSGRARVAYKRKWPRWTPPDAMVAREPELAPYSIANGGMDPGLQNPLGARALYIFQNGRDTLYRLHGTPQEWTIGRATSSGCIRLLNQDAVDLHERVPDGTPILVLPDPQATREV